jgi:hypothetical protein
MLTRVSGETSLTVSAIILAFESTPVEVSTAAKTDTSFNKRPSSQCTLNRLTMGKSQDLVLVLLQSFGDLLLADMTSGTNRLISIYSLYPYISCTDVGAPPRGAPS